MTYRTCLYFLFALMLSLCFYAPETHAQSRRKPIKNMSSIILPPMNEIPREFIAEMGEVYQECEDDAFNSGHRDCKCYSMSYLQERLLMPSVSRSTIMNVITQDCYDETAVAGHYYKTCHNLNMRTDIRDWEMLCSCFGNQMAKSIKLYNRLDFVKLSQLQARAYRACGY